MGANNSHAALPQDSPPNPQGRNRVLSIDPRSPSTDITRTPIVVEKTPEGFLQDPVDPRSPTVGIDRTPLNIVHPTKSASEKALEVVVQKLDMDVTDEADNDAEMDSNRPCDCEEQQMIDKEIDFETLGVTGIEDISLEDFPTSESTRLVPQEEQDKLMLELTEKSRVKKKKPKPSQPKELFPGRKGSTGLKDVTRSPLATRTLDMNSPLQIIQRKQVKDLDKKMTCAQENAMSKFIVREKENM